MRDWMHSTSRCIFVFVWWFHAVCMGRIYTGKVLRFGCIDSPDCKLDELLLCQLGRLGPCLCMLHDKITHAHIKVDMYWP